MRTSEWIQIGFAAILAAAAWIQPLFSHPLPVRRRWTITLFALVPWVAVTLARASAGFLAPLYVSTLRDWLTAGLFLVPYWQTGQFFQAPNHRIEQRLMDFDRWLMPRAARTSGTSRSGFGMVLEVAYLFCYPLVPLGLLALYAVGQRNHVAGFWLVVLVSTYLCYAITPFVPAYPPRDLADPDFLHAASDTAACAVPASRDRMKFANVNKLHRKSGGITSAPAQTGKTRIFNRWILKHGSIHAISFPSAHVASTFAVSLVLLHYAPIMGWIFLFISFWISLGAVIGRYHYALDVLAGAATALAVFAACYSYL